MLSFCEQRDNILTALRELTEGQLPGARPVFLRFFLSDAANQSGLLTEALADFPPCACSIIVAASSPRNQNRPMGLPADAGYSPLFSGGADRN